MDMVRGRNDEVQLARLPATGIADPRRLESPITGSVARAPVRLLVVSSDTYPPQRVDVSVLFGEQLGGRGHRIDWILQSEATCPRSHRRRWHGGSVWVGPTDLGTSLYARVRKHFFGILHDLRVFGLARKGGYDIVMVKDKFASGLFSLLAAKLFRRRFIFWLSYPFPESYLIRARDGTARYPFLYWIRGAFFWVALYRVLLPAADRVFVQSEQMRRDIARRGIALGKMTAVPMGIRTQSALQVSAGEPRSFIPQQERCFLYLGALTRVRRLDFLVRVLARVRLRIPEAKLYFVGSGDDPADERLLRDEAARLGLTQAVVHVGQLPQAQALQYVQEADVCVSPFFPTPILNSTSPTKLVEYMAMGKAVVANDHPEQQLVIQQSGGGYCVPWDEERFAEAIVELLLDPGKARLMGERGRQYVVEHRAYEAIADLVERELVGVAVRE
jgi:glycosyltransferase involved in cell wall biosynthesis